MAHGHLPADPRSHMSYDEKANVSIDADGNVLKCAKGASPTECGYVKGSDLCAKCGAIPLQMKMVPVEEMVDEDMVDSDEDDEKMHGTWRHSKSKKKKKMISIPEDADNSEDAEEAEEGEVLVGVTKPDLKKPEEKAMDAEMGGMMADEDEDEDVPDMEDDEDEDIDDDEEEDMDDEDEDMDDEDEEKMYDMSEEELEKALNYMRSRRMTKGSMTEEMTTDEEVMPEDDMSEEEVMKALEWALSKKRKMVHEKGLDSEEEIDTKEDTQVVFDASDEDWSSLREERINSLGIKSEEIGEDGYVCALNRKAHPAGMSVCDDCPGGCVAEKGLPGLLHVEGLAEKAFDGFVVDSGYSTDADMFVIDVQTKDGSVKEVFIDGTTAEIMGFQKLDSEEFEQKSDYTNVKLIDFTEAAEIAVKSIDGQVVAVEPDVFEGFDSYAVEIEGVDGKSYDVFVALDGEILGYDKYEPEEAEEIEAEAAEIALKRAFSDEQRDAMAKEGSAMPDGSYPIASENDLRNAIQAFGRAKDKEKTKRHIMMRARELKLESLIPANWLAGSNEKSDEVVNDADFMAALVEFQLLENNID